MARARRASRPGRTGHPLVWLARHLQMAMSALGQLSRNPLSALLTATVIGIALALPSGAYLLVENARLLSDTWKGQTRISLFLDGAVSDQQAIEIERRLAAREDIAATQLIDRSAALQEFSRLSGFGEALRLLDENPLPPVVVIQPGPGVNDAVAMENMARELQNYREIELAQVDLQWVERLAAITNAVERGVLMLAALLATGVLLIVGNTIRLEIQNRRSEIEIVKLVGGTDAFIRRPFLYTGLWYGLFGGIVALLMLFGTLLMLDAPIRRVALLYDSGFSLTLLDPVTLIGVLAGGPLLGLAGAWLAVSRHLTRIQPE